MTEMEPAIGQGASRRWVQRAGLSLASVAFGAGVALGAFANSETTTEVAATEVSISPTFDGKITIHDARLPADAPLGLGAKIRIGGPLKPSSGNAANDAQELATTYGALLAQPAAEYRRIVDVLQEQALLAGLLGGGATLLPIGLWTLVGNIRRQELASKYPALVSTLVAGAITTPLATGYQATHEAEMGRDGLEWASLNSVVPESATVSGLEKVEVRNTAVVGILGELTRGIIQTYEKSTFFYADLLAKVPVAATNLHKPSANQVVATFLTDRHDNINMDPIHKAMSDEAGSTILILGGDDTASGQPWEDFSLRSILEQFRGYDVQMAIDGNHKSDGHIITYYKKEGLYVPNGRVQEIGGIPILLANDPRFSSFTPERKEGQISFTEASEEVANIACTSPVRPELLVVHDMHMADETMRRGCARLAIAGHTHVLTRIKSEVADNGQIVYKQTNGSSGGAVYSFALVGKLRREATALYLTLDKTGVVAGTQAVTYQTDGTIIVGPYTELER